jgi:hypothetical protein
VNVPNTKPRTPSYVRKVPKVLWFCTLGHKITTEIGCYGFMSIQAKGLCNPQVCNGADACDGPLVCDVSARPLSKEVR